MNCNEVKQQDNELITELSNNQCKLCEADSQLTEVG